MPATARPARLIVKLGLALAGVAGLAGCMSEDGGLDLFPLYRDQGDESQGEFALLWPLSSFEWDQEGELSWTVPFHLHYRRGAHDLLTMAPLVPLYFHQRMLDHEMEGLVPLGIIPLYRTIRSGSRVDRTALLVYDWGAYEGEEGLVSSSLFPLYQWERKGPGARFSLLRAVELGPTGPLFSLLDWDTTGLSLGAESDAPALAVDFAAVFGRIVNLFHWDDEGSHDDTRFLTLFANEDWSLFQRRTPHPGAPGGDTARTIFFPLWFDIDHGEGRETTIFWPPYGQTTRDDKVVARYILFPLLKTLEDDEASIHGFDFLWPLIGRLETKRGTRTWFQPLFAFESFDGGYEWAAVLNFLGYGKLGDHSRLRLFWIPWDLGGDEETE